ncbi:hypothetical protein QQF64_005120 [Cirrhinus molitorella]|uniref:Uncharacterized protein n=1 Tax=Cirrhinus molitorella TaxID=172907 RepID=A0ABR3MID4_9TELE
MTVRIINVTPKAIIHVPYDKNLGNGSYTPVLSSKAVPSDFCPISFCSIPRHCLYDIVSSNINVMTTRAAVRDCTDDYFMTLLPSW